MNDLIDVNKNVFEIDISNECVNFKSYISEAISETELEINSLNETIESVKKLKPNCDKLDYVLAACSGLLCGIIDIFLVGKPNESPLGNITDKWFDNITIDFAKRCGWKGNSKDDNAIKSAIRFLEKKFDVPYDQRGLGDAASVFTGVNPTNHHFKSLGHNPTILGLFFSILDQFTNRSYFVSGGQLITLEKASDSFELRGTNNLSKLFCGFANWFGHLMSDVSGASTSKGRGMGIPSPFLAWTNDIIAIKSKLNIPVSEFDKNLNELAVEIFNKGFDARFQTTQAIPVVLNEFLVRLIYSIRRFIQYLSITPKEKRSFKAMWEFCEPFKNLTIKRMLTVAHGTFCLVDIGDATIRSFVSGGGTFNITEFFLRVNIAGVCRFAISVGGEIKQGIKIHKAELEADFAKREKIIVEDYLEALRELSILYDDRELVNFVYEFKNSDMYKQAFNKSVLLAEKRNVPKDKIIRTKSDIDLYFCGGKK